LNEQHTPKIYQDFQLRNVPYFFLTLFMLLISEK
jgi:hypothetical protein